MIMRTIFESALRGGILKKAVLSKCADHSVHKCTVTPFARDGHLCLQAETFYADGKARHTNLDTETAAAYLESLLLESYRQMDIITTCGNCVIMKNSAGKLHISNKIVLPRSGEEIPADLTAHDRQKRHILEEASALPFLRLLGVCDEHGKVFDKKRAKYRQINRFLELLSDVYDRLPSSGTLTVSDLCCGKSYLTFAVYWYLTEQMHRTVDMYGVDRKEDVIAYCDGIARQLGWDGLHFLPGDVTLFTPPARPNLVISLHACDIATDLVLSSAVQQKADVILSTPCCHHELFHQINCEPLSYITKHSMLSQKLCDAATDALRALRLEAEGYKVTTLELIDPEETPKNVMLRAIRRPGGVFPRKRDELLAQYRSACAFLGVSPSIGKMLGD